MIDTIITLLRCPRYPLLEKVNLYLLYKAWYRGEDLIKTARSVNKFCAALVTTGKTASEYTQIIGHFKADLLAQLYRECDKKQTYSGLATFITMSSGLPRNLLNILKHIFKASTFHGENPFQTPMSIDAQTTGVKRAAEWFFDDARIKGVEGPLVQSSIARIAELFREIRFSDKPAECSLSTFSVDVAKLSRSASHIIDLAEQYSLLLRIPRGARDRNTMRVDAKYQLNPMLAPRWDLPIARRGTIALTPFEIETICNPGREDDFRAIKLLRVNRMMAPQFGKSRPPKSSQQQNPMLFDLDND